ncbi:hypothetical protein B0H11DRAFT_2385013 [Mycena galericulata]|nr:hypothetical protein B0H11DRAFT_2385013 [Mycena galericulata]
MAKAATGRVLKTKHDLGFFNNPALEHLPANTLPTKPADQGIKTITLIGPFSDIFNFGDYSGPCGAYLTANSRGSASNNIREDGQPDDFVKWETICVTLSDWEHIAEQCTYCTEEALHKSYVYACFLLNLEEAIADAEEKKTRAQRLEAWLAKEEAEGGSASSAEGKKRPRKRKRLRRLRMRAPICMLISLEMTHGYEWHIPASPQSTSGTRTPMVTIGSSTGTWKASMITASRLGPQLRDLPSIWCKRAKSSPWTSTSLD